MKPRPCMTCKQSVPEGQGYPRYFAQSNLEPDLSTEPYHAKVELDEVFRYASAVADALPLLTEDALENKDLIYTLGQLTQSLIEEAERRAAWLYEAGQYWRKQVEADTPEEHTHNHAVRKGG